MKLHIPEAKMSGDDSLRQKQEELKRKLQSPQSNNTMIKVIYGQLILGVIGLIAGVIYHAGINDSAAVALTTVIALMFLIAIYAVIKNK